MLMSSARFAVLRHRTSYLALALLVQPCLGPCPEWNAIDIASKADINRSPLKVDAVDMKWAVKQFKPRDLVTGEKLDFVKGDKRLAFCGKGKGLNNFAAFGGYYARGEFSLGSTISLADINGLRDLDSSSWVYANYEAGTTVTSHQVSLQYGAALFDGQGMQPGWIARASIDGQIQAEKEYPGVSTVDVRLVQYDDRLEFLARPTPSNPYGDGHEGPPAFDLLFTNPQLPSTRFEIGFGAFGLDKGGKIFTDKLWFLGPDLGPEPGSDESFVFSQFSTIGGCLDDAKDQLSGSNVDLLDVQLARNQVSSALGSAMSTMFTLKDGLKDGVFEEKAAAKKAAKIGTQTYKKLHKMLNQLDKMLDKGQVNAKQLKGICKQLQLLTDSSVVGRANMLGVNVKSYKQLDTLGYPIPGSDVPPLTWGF